MERREKRLAGWAAATATSGTIDLRGELPAVDPAGASLSVPVGALVDATTLSLCGIAAPPASALGATPLGQAFQAGPEGQTFARPVTVTLPFQTALVPDGGATIGVLMAPGGSTDFAHLVSQTNLRTRVVVTTTVHFSQFVPATPGSALTVSPSPTLPNGTVGAQFGQALEVSGGAPPYTFQVAPESALPPGLGLLSDGYLAGVPTTAGVFAFFIEVSDGSGASVDVGEAITIVDPTSPVPVLTSVTPSSVQAGSGDQTIALRGSGFEPSAQTQWDGVPIATAFGSTSFLGATIPASDLASAGVHTVTVVNPAPGGGTSQGVPFSVTELDSGSADAGQDADATMPDAVSPADATADAPSEMDGEPGDASNDSACVNTSSDPNNCGSCGHVCAYGTICSAGVCTTCSPATTCGGSAFCAPQACNNVCVNVNADPNNCGGCGIVCSAPTTFCNHLNPAPGTYASCTCPLAPRDIVCNNACVDPTSDLNNCGTCNNVCAAGPGATAACNSPGTCACILPAVSCSGVCYNVQTDPNHCGSCSNQCSGSTPNCTNGACSP